MTLRGRRSASGFSLVEVLVSMAIALSVTAAVLSVTSPAQGSLQAESERADMQQRLRVSMDALYNDLLMAGNGSIVGPTRGSFVHLFASVLPFRRGLRMSDVPGTIKTDTITLVYVPQTSAQATLAQPMPAQSGNAAIALGPGCPAADAACGFAAGMSLLIFDAGGYSDLFTVTGVAGSALQLQHDTVDTPRLYASGSPIVQVMSRTYYLKTDAVARTYQLVQYDDGNGNDVPVVDHVVSLRFDYDGDPEPPRLVRPSSERRGPWTSYGPAPPPIGVRSTGYAPGENCVFARDPAGEPGARLVRLEAATSLVPLPPSLLGDGPWCPDESDPNRFDADLLRVRRIGVTLAVESAVDALRGPAGILFSHAGLSGPGGRTLPDVEIRFQVSPRNLNLDR